MRTRIFVVLACALVLALTACSSSTRMLDAHELESTLEREVEAQTGVALVDVTCQKGVPARKGQESGCTITSTDGHTARVLVTQTNDRGGVTWKLVGTS